MFNINTTNYSYYSTKRVNKQLTRNYVQEQPELQHYFKQPKIHMRGGWAGQIKILADGNKKS